MSKKDKKIGVALVKRACRVCHALEDAEIVINTRLNSKQAEDIEKMHKKVVGWIESNQYGFCKQCLQEATEKPGCFLITVDEEKSEDRTNPYRTGGIFLVAEEAILQIFGDEQGPEVVKYRAAYIPDDVAEMIGLPMDYLNGQSNGGS